MLPKTKNKGSIGSLGLFLLALIWAQRLYSLQKTLQLIAPFFRKLGNPHHCRHPCKMRQNRGPQQYSPSICLFYVRETCLLCQHQTQLMKGPWGKLTKLEEYIKLISWLFYQPVNQINSVPNFRPPPSLQEIHRVFMCYYVCFCPEIIMFWLDGPSQKAESVSGIADTGYEHF